MAQIGLKSAKYNLVDSATNKYAALTDSAVPKLERIIDEKFAAEYNAAELYADDAIAESDYSFKKGTLTITVADDDASVEAKLLGHTVSTGTTTAGETTKTINDSAPYVGYGHIVTKQVKGVKSYKVEFFPRVKFTKITTDNKTRGESVEFGTTSIEGTVFPVDTPINGIAAGTWELHKTFTLESDAATYLDTCLTPVTSGNGG